ncbi:MAG: asparagine synthetase B family protein, partial [Flavobacteriales bacterium]
KAFEIPKGYLWQSLDELAEINQCYTDFTHPRQMAILPALKQMQGEFSLGHWGDVLFDKGISTEEENMPELDIVYKKIVKPGGLVLAKMLWRNWNLEGDFENYLKQRLQTLLDGIAIEHTGAKIRAFKSLYWAPRWTSINLSVFETVQPMHVPYYDDRMCRFICEIPEAHLADRKLQIEYIKQRNPKLASIVWESQKPFNLYNYHKNVSPRNVPYRIKNKLWRSINDVLGKKYIQRNWELQFLGKNNEEALKSRVFDARFLEFVGGDTVQTIFKKFKTEDSVHYAHPLSMLLTLSIWYKNENE